ncbi:sugar ABC transporter permease [Candidatus Bipolaricaulota bacterium]|nr:sugar ABC transporter permease [Candidatus Bipolaricaulota bacterium]
MRAGKVKPWLYIAPVVILLSFFLIYPSIKTVILSFYGSNSQEFVGVKNYVFAFTNPTMVTAFRNNALWVFFFTALTVSFGLVLAVLLDRVAYESVAKSVIFLPMAISMVGASVIWKFVYAWRPPGIPQIGLLNRVVTFFGGEPIAWLIRKPWNNFFIIFVGVWIWTGFCMVVLSAAYKNIPRQLMESARVDGATEWQIFWHITLPLMRPTIAVVATTMVVFVLKIFDFVYVMTNGNYNTEVIANRMYKEMFKFQHFGRAGTLAVILLVLIIPVMIINIRRFRRQREIR